MTKKEIGVIICRFQIPTLTEGHKLILNHAQNNSDQLVVVLGISPTILTTNNPLSFQMRKTIVQSYLPHAIILGVNDISNDLLWSNELDKVLLPYDNDNIIIYGGRDSFIPFYVGKHKTFDIGKTVHDHTNATEIRNKLKDYNNFHEVASDMLMPFLLKGVDNDVLDFSFNCGVIWASQNKYPVAFATVDIGVVRVHKGDAEILLGRKYNQNVWVLMGGFVDPTDDNYLAAAKRELGEEIIGIKTSELKFIDSVKIDDWRYRKTDDKIITNLFITKWLNGDPQGADDLEEAKFFTLHQAKDVIGNHHRGLLKMIENNLELVNIKHHTL